MHFNFILKGEDEREHGGGGSQLHIELKPNSPESSGEEKKLWLGCS